MIGYAAGGKADKDVPFFASDPGWCLNQGMESTAASLETDASLPAPSFARSPSMVEEFQASVDKLREAQELASARARSETRRARLVALAALATAGIVIWNLSLRRPPHRTAPLAKAAAAAPVVPLAAVAPAAPVTSAPAPAAISAPSPAMAPAAAAAFKARAAAAMAACDGASAERQWATVISACETAFAAGAPDGALALRIAQAHHRLGHLAASGQWAREAIAANPELPEAYPILARAEAADGNRRAATAAYRRYLDLAPRGWHAAEARRALRD